MRNKLYNILDEMQELLYETNVIETAIELICESLSERKEEISEKLMYLMKRELKQLYDKEAKIVEQLDVVIMEEKKNKDEKD